MKPSRACKLQATGTCSFLEAVITFSQQLANLATHALPVWLDARGYSLHSQIFVLLCNLVPAQLLRFCALPTRPVQHTTVDHRQSMHTALAVPADAEAVRCRLSQEGYAGVTACYHTSGDFYSVQQSATGLTQVATGLTQVCSM